MKLLTIAAVTAFCFGSLALIAHSNASPSNPELTKVQTMTTTTSPDLENTLYLDVPYGRVVIELFPDVAPKHVEQIKTLTRKGFYNGIVFHRVIDGFMAQTGDPTGTGTGGSDLPNIVAEFNKKDFGRGAIGMARSASPNSGNSQFFICFDDCSFLNGQYTVWGQVTSGMEFVDQIKRGEPPANPDKIVKMIVAADENAEASKEAPKAAAQ
jgi:peptidylprolyl isomerase